MRYLIQCTLRYQRKMPRFNFCIYFMDDGRCRKLNGVNFAYYSSIEWIYISCAYFFARPSAWNPLKLMLTAIMLKRNIRSKFMNFCAVVCQVLAIGMEPGSNELSVENIFVSIRKLIIICLKRHDSMHTSSIGTISILSIKKGHIRSTI